MLFLQSRHGLRCGVPIRHCMLQVGDPKDAIHFENSAEDANNDDAQGKNVHHDGPQCIARGCGGVVVIVNVTVIVVAVAEAKEEQEQHR